ncbi:MAG: hypothetical protein HQL24_07325 [Candidatus Omnitrophica bacterium]|nr:hypothetical protein [Candidatus Omnitrophota bacterium]
MNKHKLFQAVFYLCMVSLSVFSLGFSSSSVVWRKLQNGIYEKDIRCMASRSNIPSLYIGTNRALYQSNLKNPEFKRILRIQGTFTGINDVFIPLDEPQVIFVATDNGAYQSRDDGRRWEKIFSSSDELSRRCQSIAQYGDTLYVGTLKGIFQKEKNVSTWTKVKGEFLNSPIYHIKVYDNIIYFSDENSVYSLTPSDQRAQQIFDLGASQGLEEGETSEEEALSEDLIKAIEIKGPYIFLATARGIFYRNLASSQWSRLPADAVPMSRLASFVAVKSPSINEGKENSIASYVFLAATDRGVYLYQNESWKSAYRGMETNHVSQVLSFGDLVYAATDKGIFSLSSEQALSFPGDKIKNKNEKKESPKISNLVFSDEPSVQAVHEMAVDYAEVSAQKIKTWREEAAKKAWLPSVSLGASHDRNRTTSDSIWGTYTGGGQYYRGPNDRTVYRNWGWDVSLSWDLGDIVWTSDQTSIDSRSKMMVELRGDILDQVTRLYFERRRAQMEMTNATAEDDATKIDQELRIQELTALIDGLTGGKFSLAIKEQKQEHTSPNGDL